MNPNILKFLLILLVCIPMASTDIFVPALPSMMQYFHTNISTVSLTLSSYMVGFAISMLATGALSDLYGRRKILISTMSLYIMVCLLITFTSQLKWLIILRFFQGVGGGSGTVVGRLIIKDYFKDHEQVSIMGLLSSGMAIAPAIAPQIGALCTKYLGWQSCFLVTFLIGCIILCLLIFFFKETNLQLATHNPLKKLPFSFVHAFASKVFVGYMLLIGFSWAAYFNFIGLSSFTFQNIFHYTTNQYAFVIGVVTIGYLIGTSLTRYFNRIGYSVLCIIRLGVVICFSANFILEGGFIIKSPLLMLFAMTIIRLGIGLIMPASQVGAMQVYKENVGWYMGCLFFIEFLLGGIVLSLGSFVDRIDTGLGLITSVQLCVLILFVGLYLIYPQRRDL